MSSPSRITVYQIAEACGYSPSTVSQALRGTGTIKAATRDKIRKVADDLGYRADPVFSALVAARGQKKQAEIPLLALQEGTAAFPGWMPAALANEAESLGYKLEFEHFQNPPELKRVLRMAWNRGVQLLLLNRIIEFECLLDQEIWKNFIVIAVGDYPHRPPFHHVRGSSIDAYDKLNEEITRRGYQKPGWIVRTHQTPLSLDNARVGLAHTFRHSLGKDNLLEPIAPIPLILPFETPFPKALALVKNWLNQMQPDCVLSTTYSTAQYLVELGRDIPGNLGFACEVTNEQNAGTQLHQTAMPHQVAMLIDQLFRHRVYGVQAHSPVHIMPIEWNEGRTLRKCPEPGCTDADR